MAAATSGKSAERIQLAILTLFMTAGGFLLITGILAYWLNPRIDVDVERAQSRYAQLTKLLGEKEFVALRDQAKANAEQQNDKSPVEVIQENLTKYGLEYKTLPKERRKATGKVAAKGQRTVEVTQKVDLEPAGVVQIAQFVASVLDSKKSLHVESFDLTRDRRQPDGDSWTASIEFVDYESPTEKS